MPEELSEQQALYDEADSFYERGDLGRAADVFARCAASAQGIQDSSVRELRQRALVMRAQVLSELDRVEESLAISTPLMEELRDMPTSEAEAELARVLECRVGAFARRERRLEAIDTLNELIARFADSDVPRLAGQAAVGMMMKASFLEDLDRDGEAQQVADLLRSRYGNRALAELERRIKLWRPTSDGRRMENVAGNLLLKAGLLHELRRDQEALDALDRLIATFASDPAPRLQALVAMARTGRAGLLGEIHRQT